MAFSATVEIKDAATARLNAYESAMKPESVNKVFARAGQNFVRRHFFALNAARANALGGKRTNFYSQAARGTTASSDANGATISVNQVGIRQRIQGGVILPKNGKYLTIPAKAEAYGRRAREFADLVFAVVEDSQGRKRKALVREGAHDEHWGEDDVYFWLVPRAVQKPDPSVMPRLDLMRVFLLEELGKLLAARKARKEQ